MCKTWLLPPEWILNLFISPSCHCCHHKSAYLIWTSVVTHKQISASFLVLQSVLYPAGGVIIWKKNCLGASLCIILWIPVALKIADSLPRISTPWVSFVSSGEAVTAPGHTRWHSVSDFSSWPIGLLSFFVVGITYWGFLIIYLFICLPSFSFLERNILENRNLVCDVRRIPVPRVLAGTSSVFRYWLKKKIESFFF